MEALHAEIRHLFDQHFPPSGCPRPKWLSMEHITQQKWNAWALLKSQTQRSLRGLFDCWALFTQFRLLARRHAAHAKEWRQQRVKDLMSDAARAATCHGTCKAHQLINRLAPETQKKRIQLRDKGGVPLGPLESHTVLAQFIRSTWADRSWTMS